MPVSDRLKRRAILGSTGLLPHAVRVALRERMLAALERGKARRGAFFVIGHPKSGNTWLRTMLSRAYQVKYGLPSSLVVKSDELALADPRIPRFCVSNGHYSYERVVGEILDADHPDPAFADRPVVLLVRHPCDIATSWYIQFTQRVSPAKRELINATLARPIDHRSISRWDFVMHSEIGLASIIDFLNRWERNVSRMKRHLIVRYEELRTEPLATLTRIASFLELGLSPAELEEAVSFGSFDNLRKLEASGHFRHGGFARKKHAGPDSFKVRRGKILGYRGDFEPDQVAEMDRLVADRLSPGLGYAKEPAGPAPAAP